MPNKTFFITFGGPTPNYHNRVTELCSHAKNIPYFTDVIGYTDVDLKSDSEFWGRHQSFIESSPRGYGYWIWKPYLIKRTLDQHMQNGDCLVYVDAGCTLNTNPYSWNRLHYYLESVKNSPYGMLSFQLKFPEYLYNKTNTFRHVFPNLSWQLSSEYLTTPQCMATVVIICKNERSTAFINEWQWLSTNHSLIDDSPSPYGKYKGFRDHRHDQSIYSLLVKKLGSFVIPDETYFHPNWTDGKDYPIWATRIRS